jgi:hypothetical protein
MTPEQQANLVRWIEDLRTTTEPQATGRLHSLEKGNEGYCCLGRAAVLQGLQEEPLHRELSSAFKLPSGWQSSTSLEEDWFEETYGLPSDTIERLVRMNDGSEETGTHPHTFKEIADYLETFLP